MDVGVGLWRKLSTEELMLELWCWRRLLRVPWTARRSNQSILKVISPECSLEGLMLKLKLQCFGHLMRRTDSFEKTLMLGKTEGRQRKGRQEMRWWAASASQCAWVWANSRIWCRTGKPGVLQSMGLQRVGHDWATELNWKHSLLFAINITLSEDGFNHNPGIQVMLHLVSFWAEYTTEF